MYTILVLNIFVYAFYHNDILSMRLLHQNTILIIIYYSIYQNIYSQKTVYDLTTTTTKLNMNEGMNDFHITDKTHSLN